MNDLAKRIGRIEDRQEIEDLIVRYFIASDDNDFETLKRCFAAKAVFAGTGFPVSEGRANVMVFVRAFREGVGQTVHTPNFALVSFDPESDDRAVGTVGAHIELSYGGTTVFGAFRYHDKYVREEGAWRFARRELLSIHVGPWDSISSSLTDRLNVRWPGTEPVVSDLRQT